MGDSRAHINSHPSPILHESPYHVHVGNVSLHPPLLAALFTAPNNCS